LRHISKHHLGHGLPVELRYATDAAAGIIAGYASTFNAADAHGDVVAPGAFGASLAAHKAAGTMPLMLWAHDQAAPIGIWTEAREDAFGLAVKGALNLDTARGREAYSLLKQGAINGMSIGFRVESSGAKPGLNGRRIITQIDLLEISVVAFPSNAGARVTDVKTAGHPAGLQLRDRAHLEDLLRQAGLSRGAARNIAAGGWPMLAKADDVDDDAAKLLLHNIQKLNSQIGNS